MTRQQLNFLTELDGSEETEDSDRINDDAPTTLSEPEDCTATTGNSTAGNPRFEGFLAALEVSVSPPYNVNSEQHRIEVYRAKTWRPICGLIRVTGNSYVGSDARVHLEFENDAHEICTFDAPRHSLTQPSGEMISGLLDRGFHIFGTPADVLSLIRSFPAPRIDGLREGPGWGTEIRTQFGLGQDGTRIVTDTSIADINHERLQNWQRDFAGFLSGNPHALFIVCSGFVGPLLKLIDHGPVGFHIVGPSSDSKSILAQCAADLFGAPLTDWAGTEAGLRAFSRQWNDQIVILDEMQRLTAQDLGSKIYALLNGRDRALKSDGTSRDGSGWSICYLSTGEDSVENILSVGKQLRAGHMVRLIDLPEAPRQGLWSNQNGAEVDCHSFIRARADASRINGTAAGFAFLARLIAGLHTYKGAVRPWLNEERSILIDSLAAHRSENQIQRVLTNFSIVALAGRVAVSLGILPQSLDDIRSSVIAMARGWLLNRTDAPEGGRAEAARVVRQFIDWTAARGQAGCLCLQEARANPRRIARLGWQDPEYLYLLPSAIEAAISDQTSRSRAVRFLNDAGLVIKGGEAQSLQYKLSINGARPHVYRICKDKLSKL